VSSYAAFLLALALGHIALINVLAGKRQETVRPIYQSVYRAMQIGVLLLATGVVLGAFWANYSWGRFWDWDPKETWALIALLCYLFLLHGRIAGWWGGFGLSVGAVLAFQAVLMAWYGVNFLLGKGLHSYGFGSGGSTYAYAFVAVEVVFVAIAIAVMLRRRKPPLIDAPTHKSETEPV
jgi:ABC-type transport system involved in cytochrome c biogenesis permease subunit